MTSFSSPRSSTYLHYLKSKNTFVDPSKICVNDYKDLPQYWKPPRGAIRQQVWKLDAPWTAQDSALAEEASYKGLDELIAFYHKISKKRIQDLSSDAVNSLMDETYGTGGWPKFRKRALEETARLLIINGKDAVEDAKKKPCEDMYTQMKYVGYGQYLVNNLPNHTALREIQDQLVVSTNRMFRQCGSLPDILALADNDDDESSKEDNDFDFATMFDDPDKADGDDVYDWLLSAIALTDCLTVPGLKVPDGAEEFLVHVWEFLSRFEFPYARDYRKHYKHEKTMDESWTVTHSAYLPTGYGRHQQWVSDAPWLYRYIRENYFYSMERGMLDHFSEFIDLLRQYGCTEENDYQLRVGTRYILDLYKKSNRSWMNHKGTNDDDDDVKESDYDKIHKPWTAISGVIPRQFEPAVPGSYGYAFQQAMLKYSLKKKASMMRKRS